MKILVKFSKDWADEFDVKGWKVFDTREQWQQHRDQISKGEFYFGTNEGWDGSEFADSDFDTQQLTDEDAQVLTDIFGYEWGHFPS